MLKINIRAIFFNLIKYNIFYFDTKFFGDYSDLNISTYLSKQIENKKIIIYGFGPYGEEYFVKLFDKNRIMGIYDKNYALMENNYIESPYNISKNDFDYVIVTVMNQRARSSIINFLIEKGVAEKKIVFVEYNK